jgi:hypothetical protein
MKNQSHSKKNWKKPIVHVLSVKGLTESSGKKKKTEKNSGKGGGKGGGSPS